MTMMRPFWSAIEQAVGGGKLVRYGTPVTYTDQVSSYTLPAASVFAGGIVLAQVINRGGTTLPATPSGWTLIASGTGASTSCAIFGKRTPVSENTTLSLSAVNYTGGIWAMKFESGSPIQNLRVDGTVTLNIGSPGSSTNTIPRTKKTTAKANVFAFNSLYMRNDTTVGLSFAGLETPGTVEEIFNFTTANDSHIFNAVSDDASIQNDGGGTFNSTGTGLTSANAYAHCAFELDLNPLPPGALTPVYRTAQFSSTQQSVGVPYSFNSNQFGPVGADRYIVVCVATAAVAGTNTAPTVTSVVVDGVALTQLASKRITPGSGLTTELWGGYVNTANTSGNITVTFGTTSTRGCTIATFSVHGSENISVVTTRSIQYASSGCNFGAHTMVEDTDAWIGFGHHFGNTATFGWTVATEQHELNYATSCRASSALMTLSGSRTPTFSSASAGDGAACSVQLRGA